jgi:hypothetical protein
MRKCLQHRRALAQVLQEVPATLQNTCHDGALASAPELRSMGSQLDRPRFDSLRDFSPLRARASRATPLAGAR